jgi:hypothetical protein
VSELHSGDSSLLTNKTRNPRERLDLFIFPDAKILRADPPLWRYSGSFRENDSCSTHGTAPKMYEMPIRRKTVDGRILAHRRNNYSVF